MKPSTDYESKATEKNHFDSKYYSGKPPAPSNTNLKIIIGVILLAIIVVVIAIISITYIMKNQRAEKLYDMACDRIYNMSENSYVTDEMQRLVDNAIESSASIFVSKNTKKQIADLNKTLQEYRLLDEAFSFAYANDLMSAKNKVHQIQSDEVKRSARWSCLQNIFVELENNLLDEALYAAYDDNIAIAQNKASMIEAAEVKNSTKYQELQEEISRVQNKKDSKTAAAEMLERVKKKAESQNTTGSDITYNSGSVAIDYTFLTEEGFSTCIEDYDGQYSHMQDLRFWYTDDSSWNEGINKLYSYIQADENVIVATASVYDANSSYSHVICYEYIHNPR